MKSETERETLQMKKIFFILTSGAHISEKEKYAIDFCIHISTPGPFKSFNQIKISPHRVSAFCESITGMSMWRGYYIEPGSPGQ